MSYIGAKIDRDEAFERPPRLRNIEPIDPSEVTETLERPSVRVDVDLTPVTASRVVVGGGEVLEIESLATPEPVALVWPASSPSSNDGRAKTAKLTRPSLPPALPPAFVRASRASMAALSPSASKTRASTSPARSPLPSAVMAPVAFAPLSLSTLPSRVPPPPASWLRAQSNAVALASPPVTNAEAPSLAPVAASIEAAPSRGLPQSQLPTMHVPTPRPSRWHLISLAVAGLAGASLVGLVAAATYSHVHDEERWSIGTVAAPPTPRSPASAVETSARSTEATLAAAPSPVPSPEPSASVPSTPSETASASAKNAVVSVDALPKLAADPDKTLVKLPRSARGHRIFVDGRVASSGASPFMTKCGERAIQIGSAGKGRILVLPCGGQITLD